MRFFFGTIVYLILILIPFYTFAQTDLEDVLLAPEKAVHLNLYPRQPFTDDIGKLTNLKYLSIDYRYLGYDTTSLPKNFSKLINLEELIINGSDFKKFPVGLDSLKKLKKVSLYNCYGLNEFPIDFFKCPNLEEFKFDGLVDKMSNPEIKCYGLKKLIISSINSDSFPENLSQLTNLEVLTICSKTSKVVPAFIINLIKLKSLNLSYGNINNISADMSRLSNLEYLGLCYNNLTEVPDYVLQLPKLRFLDLYGNNINSLVDYWRFNKELVVNDDDNPHDLNIQAEENAKNGIFSKLKTLINSGASASGKMLFYAVQKGDMEIIKFLVENGADVNYINYTSRLFQSLLEENSLSLALYKNQYSIAEYLIENGADIDVKLNGSTFLKSAAFDNNFEKVKFLISHGANVNQEFHTDSIRIENFILEARSKPKIYPKNLPCYKKYVYNVHVIVKDFDSKKPIKSHPYSLYLFRADERLLYDYDGIARGKIQDLWTPNGFRLRGLTPEQIAKTKFHVKIDYEGSDKKYADTLFEFVNFSVDEPLVLFLKREKKRKDNNKKNKR